MLAWPSSRPHADSLALYMIASLILGENGRLWQDRTVLMWTRVFPILGRFESAVFETPKWVYQGCRVGGYPSKPCESLHSDTYQSAYPSPVFSPFTSPSHKPAARFVLRDSRLRTPGHAQLWNRGHNKSSAGRWCQLSFVRKFCNPLPQGIHCQWLLLGVPVHYWATRESTVDLRRPQNGVKKQAHFSLPPLTTAKWQPPWCTFTQH